MDGGWEVREFSSNSATFFCTRGNDRRMISIDFTDPHDAPISGASHLGARGYDPD